MNDFPEISEPVLVWTGKVMLEARLAVPSGAAAAAIIVTAPTLTTEGRDVELQLELNRCGIATLLTPLLTEGELQFDLQTSQYRLDADFLAQRFVDVAQWLSRNESLKELPLAFIGASSSGAAAILAAAMRPDLVTAVVSIDGRTDLAIDSIRNVKTPTLLVVHDMPVLRMNREALTLLRGEKRLEIVHAENGDVVQSVVQKAVLWLADKLTVAPAVALNF